MYQSCGDVDNGEGRPDWGQGLFGKSLYLLLNFAVNLKLLQKIKAISLKSLFVLCCSITNLNIFYLVSKKKFLKFKSKSFTSYKMYYTITLVYGNMRDTIILVTWTPQSFTLFWIKYILDLILRTYLLIHFSLKWLYTLKNRSLLFIRSVFTYILLKPRQFTGNKIIRIDSLKKNLPNKLDDCCEYEYSQITENVLKLNVTWKKSMRKKV